MPCRIVLAPFYEVLMVVLLAGNHAQNSVNTSLIVSSPRSLGKSQVWVYLHVLSYMVVSIHRCAVQNLSLGIEAGVAAFPQRGV